MIAVPAGKFTEMVGQYVAQQTGMDLKPDSYQAMMVVDDNKDFVAGVVISNFRGTDVEVSCASESPAAWRPHVCKAIFTYIFEQLGCVRCTSITTRANKRARSFLESLGFQLEGNLRLAYDGKRDALIYGLLKSECRYLGDLKDLEHGQEKRPDATDAAGPGSDGERPGGGEYEGGDDPGGTGSDQSVHATG
jgi:hypothetical protein